MSESIVQALLREIIDSPEWHFLCRTIAHQVLKSSFFETCPRDDKGHCKPSGKKKPTGHKKPAKKPPTSKKPSPPPITYHDPNEPSGPEVIPNPHRTLTFGATEQRHAEAQQDKLATAIDKGAAAIPGNAPSDVERQDNNGNLQAIEVKTKLKGKTVRMTAAAQARKVMRLEQHHQTTGKDGQFHTVAFDHRAAFKDGDLSKAQSFPCYYKRGAGTFALADMLQVNSPDELNRLMSRPDEQLPEKAKPAQRGFWAAYNGTKNSRARAKMIQDALANERKRHQHRQGS